MADLNGLRTNFSQRKDEMGVEEGRVAKMKGEREREEKQVSKGERCHV